MGIYQLSADEQSALWTMVGEVRALLIERYAPDGFNIAVNSGIAAAQTIEHAHIHVIPRRKGDLANPRGGVRNIIPENARYWKSKAMVPTADYQVQFLLKILHLLRDGAFTATYKFALLLALADLSVELGDESGDALELGTRKIGEKFIEYYWRQTVPFLGKDVLRQNTGKPPAVVTKLLSSRQVRRPPCRRETRQSKLAATSW